MGSVRLRTIEAQLKNLEKLESKKGFDFKTIKWRIQNLGSKDYEMRKAIVFRENFLLSLEKLALNNDIFEEIFDFFNSIKNPLQFYETTQRSEILQDFFLWYQQPESYMQFSDVNELGSYILSHYKGDEEGM